MGNLTLKKIRMSKINQEQLKTAIEWIRENRKQRNFVETCDLQILLRDYNPEKEKRFNSTVVLPNQAKSRQKVCVIANVTHLEQCKKHDIPCIDMDAVKKFNKQGKPIKKWARTFDFLLVSETINKQVAAQMGKILSSVHKLPLLLGENEKVVDKLKDEELRMNINKSLNFLISLLPKGWHNIRTVN